MKASELKQIIREEIQKVLSEANNATDQNALEPIVDKFLSLINDTEMQEQQLTEIVAVWTPAASEGLAALGAEIGLGAVESHLVLFGGMAIAMLIPAMASKYETFLQYLKGRKLANPHEMKRFKDEIIAQSKNLSRGKQSYISGTLNKLLSHVNNKEYARAFRMSQSLADKINTYNKK
jgi:hypothetical protein